MLQLNSVAVNRANMNLCGSFLNWIFTTHYLFRESRWGLSTEWEVKMFSSFKQGWKTQSISSFLPSLTIRSRGWLQFLKMRFLCSFNCQITIMRSISLVIFLFCVICSYLFVLFSQVCWVMRLRSLWRIWIHKKVSQMLSKCEKSLNSTEIRV